MPCVIQFNILFSHFISKTFSLKNMGLQLHLFETWSLIAGISINCGQASEESIYHRGNEMKGKWRKSHAEK
jgi:hypothetical protein